MAGKPGLVWSADPDLIIKNMKGATQKAHFYLSRTTEFYSLRAETSAKKNAPWTDRSTNARSGLGSNWTGSLSDSGGTFEINVFHSVPYGIWLEIKYGGRFSIINKTVDAEGKKFFNTANQVMARMFGGS